MSAEGGPILSDDVKDDLFCEPEKSASAEGGSFVSDTLRTGGGPIFSDALRTGGPILSISRESQVDD